MHRSGDWLQKRIHGFADQAVVVPQVVVGMRSLGQLDRTFHMRPKRIALTDGLSVALIHPLHRTISSKHQQRNTLIKCFGNGRSVIQNGCPGSASHGNRLPQLLRHSQCKKSRTALIYNGIALKLGTVSKNSDDGCIA